MPTTNSQKPTYELRLVAFLDVLGFRDIVRRTLQSDQTLEEILSAIELMLYEKSDCDDESDITGHDKRVTQFSDSIVISYRVESQASVFYLLLDLLMLTIAVAGRGVLLRGGIAIGKLIHTDKYLIGPAMIDAYNLESKVADFPRVIVDAEGYNALLAAAGENHYHIHDPETEQKYVADLLTADADGNYFLDYISWKSTIGAGLEPDEYPVLFGTLSRVLQRELSGTDPSVLKKYLWLHARFKAQLHAIVALPVQHAWRQEFPEEYEFYCSMDDLEEAANRARAIVDAQPSSTPAMKA